MKIIKLIGKKGENLQRDCSLRMRLSVMLVRERVALEKATFSFKSLWQTILWAKFVGSNEINYLLGCYLEHLLDNSLEAVHQ